ncbi:MAG TPA: metal-dependent hydrolase [Candidatus Binatia bacterium]|nr:metal-dependent hydrolase [Candidatus Binatia bacterium]
MAPLTHFLGSWLVASAAADNPRDRTLITLAGVLPDADGLGIVVDMAHNLTSGKEPTFHYYQQYHHLLLHGWPGAILVSFILTGFARKKWRVLIWCLVAYHLHLLCDLLGSRGPDVGDLWPICYSEPLFRHPIWFWKGQWKLDGWQNQTITLALFGVAIWVAVKRGYSFVEVFSERADKAFVQVLRKWFVRTG